MSDLDIVVVKTRTGKNEEFRFDGAPIVIDHKKGLRVERWKALLAINANALRWNPTTGLVIDSKVYIEDDIGTPLAMPHKSLTPEQVRAIKSTDGLGKDKMIIDGKLVGKTVINLDPTVADLETANASE